MIKKCIYILLFVLTGCDFDQRMPSDSDLIANFNKYESTFNSLSESYAKSPQILRLANDFEEIAKDFNIEHSEKEMLLTEMSKVNLKEGYLKGKEQSFYLIHSSEGLVSAGVSKGYYYADKNPDEDSLVSSLDDVDNKSQNAVYYKKINQKWYLFLEYSG